MNKGVGGGEGGYIGSVGINSFFSFSFPFLFFSGAMYWVLATVTCNFYLFIHYYIIYMVLSFTSLHLAEILGGNLSSGLVWHFLLFPLLGIVAYRYQYSASAAQYLTNFIHPPSYL